MSIFLDKMSQIDYRMMPHHHCSLHRWLKQYFLAHWTHIWSILRGLCGADCARVRKVCRNMQVRLRLNWQCCFKSRNIHVIFCVPAHKCLSSDLHQYQRLKTWNWNQSEPDWTDLRHKHIAGKWRFVLVNKSPLNQPDIMKCPQRSWTNQSGEKSMESPLKGGNNICKVTGSHDLSRLLLV